jgi:hypothetical protein
MLCLTTVGAWGLRKIGAPTCKQDEQPSSLKTYNWKGIWKPALAVLAGSALALGSLTLLGVVGFFSFGVAVPFTFWIASGAAVEGADLIAWALDDLWSRRVKEHENNVEVLPNGITDFSGWLNRFRPMENGQLIVVVDTEKLFQYYLSLSDADKKAVLNLTAHQIWWFSKTYLTAEVRVSELEAPADWLKKYNERSESISEVVDDDAS